MMAETTNDPLGAESLMGDVHAVTGFGWRRNGSEAARNTAMFIRDEFEASGLETSVETWPFNLYYPHTWSVRARDASGTAWRANSIPIWYSAPGVVTGPAVYVDIRTGKPELAGVDLAGKIVLADVTYVGNFLPTDGSSTGDAGLYAAAVQAGAVGYVRRAAAPGNSVMLMHFAQNFPTHDEPARLGPIPASTVGQADFDRLRDAARSGLEIEISNTLTDVPKGEARTVEGGSLGPGQHTLRATVDDVIGRLPGMSDEIVVVAAHYDSTFDGAVDNATGDAVLLGLMRHYASLPLEKRAKTMLFVASGAHDTGDFDLYHFVEHHRDDLARTIAFDWLDHMAADAETAGPGSNVSHGVIAAHNATLLSHLADQMGAYGIPTEPVLGPASTISHLPGDVPSYNVTLAPSWYHSPEDTVEKVPAAELANMAQAQRALLDTLLGLDGASLRAANAEGGDDVRAVLAGLQQESAHVANGVFFTIPAQLPRGRHSLGREQIAEAHRERLMIAATELLSSQGVRDFGIREICKEASMSQTAFYEQFADKDACIFAAYDRFISVLVTRMTSVTSGSATDTITQFVQQYVGTLQEDPVTARAFQVEMETLGSEARRIRRLALGNLADTLAARLAAEGLSVSRAAALNAVYAIRQTISDLLDEQRSPDLTTTIAGLAEWAARMLRPEE